MASSVISRTDGLVGEFGIKAPVRVASTASLTLSGEQTIDGVAVSQHAGTSQPPDRVLVKDQSDQTTNGIYAVQQGAWLRSADFDGPEDVARGTLIFVTDGSTNANKIYGVSTANPVIIDGNSASNITFTALSLGNAGDVVGPASAVDGGFAIFDGTTGKLLKSATGSGANLTNATVSNAKLANVATSTIKGRTTAGTGAPEDLTATQATALLNAMVGDSGAGVTKGLVPAASTGNATIAFLRKDGTFAVPAGTGAGTLDTVEDGSTTVSGPTILKFSGATVTESPSGTALVTISETFRGALLALTGDQSVGASGSISWDAATYDTSSFFDHATHPTRLTVPSGVTHVRLSGGADLSGYGTTVIIGINKNGSDAFPGRPVLGAATGALLTFSSPVLVVTAEDYFEFVFSNGGSGTIVNDGSTYFGIEAV